MAIIMLPPGSVLSFNTGNAALVMVLLFICLLIMLLLLMVVVVVMEASSRLLFSATSTAASAAVMTVTAPRYLPSSTADATTGIFMLSPGNVLSFNAGNATSEVMMLLVWLLMLLLLLLIVVVGWQDSGCYPLTLAQLP